MRTQHRPPAVVRRIGMPGVALAALVLAGCATIQAPVQPPGGLIYTHIRAPLSVDFSGQSAGEAAAKTFRDRAYDVGWQAVIKRSPEAGPKLRQLAGG